MLYNITNNKMNIMFVQPDLVQGDVEQIAPLTWQINLSREGRATLHDETETLRLRWVVEGKTTYIFMGEEVIITKLNKSKTKQVSLVDFIEAHPHIAERASK